MQETQNLNTVNKSIMQQKDNTTLSNTLFSIEKIQAALNAKVYPNVHKETHLKVWFAGLFGSRAKGYHTALSDIDLYAVYTVSDEMARKSLFYTQEFFEHRHPNPKTELLVPFTGKEFGVDVPVTVRFVSLQEYLQKISNSNYDYCLSLLEGKACSDDPIAIRLFATLQWFVLHHCNRLKIYYSKMGYVTRIVKGVRDGNLSNQLGVYEGELANASRSMDFAHSVLTCLVLRHILMYNPKAGNVLEDNAESFNFFTSTANLSHYLQGVENHPFYKQIKVDGLLHYISQSIGMYKATTIDFDYQGFLSKLSSLLSPDLEVLRGLDYTNTEDPKLQRMLLSEIYNTAVQLRHDK